jgi:hypothetical protein
MPIEAPPDVTQIVLGLGRKLHVRFYITIFSMIAAIRSAA